MRYICWPYIALSGLCCRHDVAKIASFSYLPPGCEVEGEGKEFRQRRVAATAAEVLCKALVCGLACEKKKGGRKKIKISAAPFWRSLALSVNVSCRGESCNCVSRCISFAIYLTCANDLAFLERNGCGEECLMLLFFFLFFLKDDKKIKL